MGLFVPPVLLTVYFLFFAQELCCSTCLLLCVLVFLLRVL
jgi:hypothetical protein